MSDAQKVDILPSDVPFSWEAMTAEKYREFEQKVLRNRDRIMADGIIQALDGTGRSGATRKKALVIMNYRHAFNDFRFADGGQGDNVGRYLFEKYPGRVANVLINTVVPLVGSTDRKAVIGLIQDGRWDAAFAAADNPAAGFDLDGSPFGEDTFDLFPHRASHLKYKDVFTGFVFYRPLWAHRLESGAPGLVDESFAPTLMERFRVMGAAGDGTLEDFERMAKVLATPMVRRYGDDHPELDRKLREAFEKWLMAPAPDGAR